MMTVKTLDQLLKENIISQRTYDKVILSKQYIERKYNLKSKQNLEMQNFLSQLNLYNVKQSQINNIKNEIFQNQKNKYRKSREKQSIFEYESLSIIGRGAFGEVHVCREKKTGNIYAIKKIRKNVLEEKNQIIHIRNEQYFMSNVKSEWIVDLKASFQDGDFLYLVMEFCPGGDLMNLLIEKDILTEKEAKFYLAELILAIESIHKLDCIHRDIKPDNILIDTDGHIKLSDFGLSKISEKIFEKNENKNNISMHNKNYSCVGTAFYVAPEVLKKSGYGPEIDWWSAGVIFYEMLVGYAPFCSKETNEVCYKVMNWEKYLEIPKKIKMKMSDEAQDLIYKLISNKNKRLGKNGASEIKKHPFFNDIDWDNVRKIKAPFIPYLETEYDTKYFHTFKEIEPFYPKLEINHKRKDIEYLGYTYKEENDTIDQKDIFEKIKKSLFDKNINENEKLTFEIVDDNNKKKNEIRSKSKKDLFDSNKNKISEHNKSIQNISRNKIYIISKNNQDSTPKPKDIKLNVIKLPNKKSKNNIINIQKIMNMNTISLSTMTRNKINQINNTHKTNKTNKTVKRLSPKPNYDFILKLLNLSKDKINQKAKSKSKTKNTSRQRSTNYIVSKFNNISKKLININNTNSNIIKKGKMNNNIKIINIIQNRNYNNIVHHNMSHNGKNSILKKNVKIPYNLTSEN